MTPPIGAGRALPLPTSLPRKTPDCRSAGRKAARYAEQKRRQLIERVAVPLVDIRV